MNTSELAVLGWTDHFARQINDETVGAPARVIEVSRDHLTVLTPEGQITLVTPDETGLYAVGDWVLHDGSRVITRLDRMTEIVRKAAGPQAGRQLIAANVDTLAVVTSCNADFNEARLERYLAMTAQAGCLPLIVLTKADLSDDADELVKRAARLSPLVTAIAINAKDPEDANRLAPWCSKGQTLALVGSSGVGKTTLQNHLTGLSELTQDIREDDAKGRHTTTARALRPTLAGGWLIDTPGIRELALTDASDGIDAVFAEITDLAGQCRFNDCAHESEPGCAIKAAIEAGDLDPDRLERWRKLQREDRFNSESVAEARARFRKLGKMYRIGKDRGETKRR
ncbi:ribosome small subunit-dependent GTPase A [Ponticoccus sp. SC2-23]|nr:ribosome small subunit-dependent GTPase A [Alexandriicola marinus]MBM1222137.1 ribosome small subunit-dependent GTPase A [Ponticoccus sp. SC6-9]MBM1226824.1 ribosome small subunit-dependent GTPase A [Ponticoccus sp. SC6-15]MBM1231084.1 ribosome small subunit-dependent GTPase A [Ponticoccus sp. SC6-38]MBM1235664.1 ribosome small subunit-dependent GTPase A [Ponticoccus sp. SC6-45]MBM1240106.1 ribosome small subunit-dependent GTPase A [Ponticoccus sp. SC6-49]MBM1244460.1 ribosome small subuni